METNSVQQSNVRVAIIGAGISGTMAAGATSSLSPTLFEASSNKSCLENHEAVMRVRDPNVALLMGCDLDKIRVQKMAYIDGQLISESNITANNMYSMKTTGTIRNASIQNLGFCDRYLIRSKDVLFPKCKVECNHRLKTVKTMVDFSLEFEVPGFQNEKSSPYDICFPYDICISTIPLPVMLQIVGIKIPEEIKFKTTSIHVGTSKLKTKSYVHQTIYFPQLRYKTYRATLEGNEFILEATDVVQNEELVFVLNTFNIKPEDMQSGWFKWTEQKNGKMTTIDGTIRRQLIWELTDKFNIFSLGRYAIWKPIRTDELLTDLNIIKKLIRVKSGHMDRYAISKARTE